MRTSKCSEKIAQFILTLSYGDMPNDVVDKIPLLYPPAVVGFLLHNPLNRYFRKVAFPPPLGPYSRFTRI